MPDERIRETPDDETPARQPRRARRRDDDDFDDEDDQPRRPTGDGGTSTLIPYKNVPALVGYYLGVFSLIPCVGLILGPVACILGIVGLVVANKNPQAKGTAHAIVALVLGGLVTLGYIGGVVFVASGGLR